MDCDNSKEYTLSIRLMPDGFSFSIHNPGEENSLRYETCLFGSSANYAAVLEDEILSREELLLPYRRVNIIIASSRFSLVPIDLFAESQKEKFYEFLQTPVSETILSDMLEHTRAVNVYGVEQQVYAFLCRTFCNPVFRHHLSVMSEYFILKSRMGNYDKMICQMRYGMLDILCFRKGSLMLANTFKYRHINDVVYFILATWKSLRMEPHTDSLQLTGNSADINELTTLLNPYIAAITPVVFPAQMFNLGKESMETPFDLIVFPLCV
ncbi:MAG: DUF3822 family protein [Bacteroidales bacterium]